MGIWHKLVELLLRYLKFLLFLYQLSVVTDCVINHFQLRARVCFVQAEFTWNFLGPWLNWRLLPKGEILLPSQLNFAFFSFFLHPVLVLGWQAGWQVEACWSGSFPFHFQQLNFCLINLLNKVSLQWPIPKPDTEEAKTLKCAAQGCTRLRCDTRFCPQNFVR